MWASPNALDKATEHAVGEVRDQIEQVSKPVRFVRSLPLPSLGLQKRILARSSQLFIAVGRDSDDSKDQEK